MFQLFDHATPNGHVHLDELCVNDIPITKRAVITGLNQFYNGRSNVNDASSTSYANTLASKIVISTNKLSNQLFKIANDEIYLLLERTEKHSGHDTKFRVGVNALKRLEPSVAKVFDNEQLKFDTSHKTL